MSLIQDILESKGSVREIIDRATRLNEGPLSDLADAVEDGEASQQSREAGADQEPSQEQSKDENANEYRHLFVRRWRKDAEKPYKRAKLDSSDAAVKLFIEWADKYKQEKVEIWSDVAMDAKNFYRFCLKNRETLEPLWKTSQRVRKSGLLWPAAYKMIQSNARQSGNNLVGTLSPFEVDVK